MEGEVIAKPTLSFGISSILGNLKKQSPPLNVTKGNEQAFSAFRPASSAREPVKIGNIKTKTSDFDLRGENNNEAGAAASECQPGKEPTNKCQTDWTQAASDKVDIAGEDKNGRQRSNLDIVKCQSQALAVTATTSFPIIPNTATQSYLLKSLERLQPKNYGMSH